MAIYLGSTEITPAILSGVDKIYLGSKLVWSAGLPVGTVYNFEYTGSVQSVELPKGKYKLQCWGAQGGSVTDTYASAGSKGGYSEGVLTLTKTTTLYIFVGGKGTDYTSSASQTSTSVVNGGWNGGGAGRRTSRYNSGDTDGRSFPRGGGGSTDISTVTSTLSYSNGRTTRDSASLLARCIIAGGGAGASAWYTIKTVTNTTTKEEQIGYLSEPRYTTPIYNSSANRTFYRFDGPSPAMSVGDKIKYNVAMSGLYSITLFYYNSSGSSTYIVMDRTGTTIPSDFSSFYYWYLAFSGDTSTSITNDDIMNTIIISKIVTDTTTSTSNSSGYSNKSQQGGGTSGKGQYPGTQSAAGSGGAFGLGASQSSTNYRYCGGGGGGGWYGGGTSQSDSSTSYVNYTGGGSGFVNTAANSSYRPSGYTGLQLDSGTTTAGDTSHPSTSGGTETGHSGNGYARITVIE